MFCPFLRFYGRNRACSIRNQIHEKTPHYFLLLMHFVMDLLFFFVDIYLITPFFIFCLVCLFYVGYINLSQSTHTHIHTKYIHKGRNQSGTIFGCYKLLHKTPIIFIIMSNNTHLKAQYPEKREYSNTTSTLCICVTYILMSINQTKHPHKTHKHTFTPTQSFFYPPNTNTTTLIWHFLLLSIIIKWCQTTNLLCIQKQIW